MTDHVPSKSDIDFSRGKVCIAFLNDATSEDGGRDRLPEEHALESHFDLEAQVDTPESAYNNDKSIRNAWKGVFHGLFEALRSIFVRSYTKSRHFAHCELCFFCSPQGTKRYGKEYMIACGTREDSGVRIVARRFNEHYTWLYINTTESEMRHIVNFVFAQHGKKYDGPATSQIFTRPRPTAGRRWYCSELVMCALQMLPCAHIHSQRPNCVEVDDVYAIAKQSQRLSQSSLEISPYQVHNVYKGAALVDDLGFA